MSIKSLFKGFIDYLTDSQGISAKKLGALKKNDLGKISIFMKYRDEFKTYLSDEINVDPDIVSKSVSEILDMQIKKGKIVDPDSTDKEEGKNVKSYGKNPTIKMGERAITDMLNMLFDQDNIKELIDTNKDGKVNKKEIKSFINSIKGYDGDGENITLEDVMNAMDSIADGTFSLDPEAAEQVENEVKAQKAELNRGNGSVGGVGGGGGGGIAPGNVSNGVEEKTLDNMDKSELNAELDKSETTLSDKQKKLSNVLNGSDPTLVSLKKDEEEAYEKYNKELKESDKELAKELDDIVSDINDKEKEISAKEKEISNKETEVSENETAYKNATATVQNLEMSMQALKAVDTSEMDEDRKNELNALISNLEKELDSAKEKEKSAKEELDKSKEDLNDAKEEKEELISGKGGLDELNDQKAELESTIEKKYPEIKEYMDAYNDAKDEYTRTKDRLTTEARKEVEEAQDYVSEVKTAINNYDNKEKAKEYNFGTFGKEILDFAKTFIGCNEADGSANKFVAAWGTTAAATPWCAAFVDYVMSNSGEYDNVPDWYKNIDNKWYCPNVYSAANAAGAVISAQEAQQGDIVLFDFNGDGTMDHIGIVDSNDGNTIVTIEGNTSNQVAQRSYNINDGKLKFCRIAA